MAGVSALKELRISAMYIDLAPVEIVVNARRV